MYQLIGRGAAGLFVFCASLIIFMLFSQPVLAAYWSYTFNSSGTLLEAGSSAESSSPYFWLNSGGKMPISGGLGMTQQGALSWGTAFEMYKTMNSLDTDGGKYPQNTFRLVTKQSWTNFEEQVKFRITKTNLTNTPNRDGYSGMFLMSRYTNSDNLYYVGVRHDGQVVIKKKIGGVYHTLAYAQVFGVQSDYDKWAKPNLMPQNAWMGLRGKFENLADGSVRITASLDKNNSGVYTNVLTAIDKGTGGTPHKAAGKVGIRTDFMDVQFDDYVVRSW